jgi:CubicO group peptidase (beta-lactamase class C family)
MMRFLLAFLVASLAATPVLAQTPDASARLHAWFDPLVESRDFSGMIAIRQSGQPLQLETFGYADWQAGTRFGASSRIPAGTLTQGLTHALILQLASRGTIEMDAPLSHFIPEWPGARLITVRDVLEDRAGLPASWPADAPIDGSSHQLVGWLQTNAIIRPDPHEVSPSMIGEALLALVVERALSGRFETWASARLLGPLDMNDSRVVRGAIDSDPTPYRAGPLPWDLTAVPGTTSQLGSTGLVTTMADLLNWGDAVATRRVDLFEANGALHGGFAVTQIGEQVIYVSQSESDGIVTGLALLPRSGLTIAWTANIDAYATPHLGAVIPSLVLGIAIDPAPARALTYEPRDEHGAALGMYDWPDVGAVEIADLDGSFWLITENARRYLTPLGEAALLDRATHTRLDFVRDEDGWVTGLSAHHAPAQGVPVSFDVRRTDPRPVAEPPAD